MLSSSPQPDRLLKRNAAHFSGQILVGPSSPSAAYQDGEISPSFDASFASSMSITSDERNVPSPLGIGSGGGLLEVDTSSPVMAMDISPAPPAQPTSASVRAPPLLRPLELFGRTTSQPQTATINTLAKPERPFLRDLFRPQQSAPPTQTTFPPIAPLSIPRSTSPDAFAGPLPLASTSAATSIRPKKPRSRPSSGSGGHSRRPSLTHTATAPTNSDRTRPSLTSNDYTFGSTKARRGDENLAPGEDGFFGSDSRPEENLVPSRYPASSRPRSALPSSWNRTSSGLAPPIPPVKRRSDSSVPKSRKEIEGSPFRMEIDAASPRNLASPLSPRRSVSDSAASTLIGGSPAFSDGSTSQDGAQGQLEDIWDDSASGTPLPATRKRLLEQENSPTPASPTPSSNLSSTASVRSSFGKVSSLGGPAHVARRQRSSLGLSHISRRPSLASFGNVSGSASSSASILSDSGSSANSSYNKRFATQAENGRPSHSRHNSSRRTLSVADAASASAIQHSPALLGGGIFQRDLNIPMESPRPALIPVDGPDYFAGAGTGKGNGKGKGKRVGASIDLGPAVKACMSPDRASPIAGPREQEIRGKALPCFKSLADGFMRITPETLTLLQSGHFSNKHIANYQIIDCRFEYEYVGGHIKEAINLPSMSQIENVLLTADKRPRPSTSEEPLPEGRTVLIFHCEFSASRAPTSAGLLRKTDRTINWDVYPRISYPEVYILQGGYKAFFNAYPERCVGGYVEMDDPVHNTKRSQNLEQFRKQKGVFSRASSFTFGQAQHASALLRNAEGGPRRPISYNTKKTIEPMGFVFPNRDSTTTTPSAAKNRTLSVHDEDGEGDSSFGTNGSSPCGNGGSPCPPTSKALGRPSFKLPSQPFSISSKLLNPKRPMAGRSQTTTGLPFAPR